MTHMVCYSSRRSHALQLLFEIHIVPLRQALLGEGRDTTRTAILHLATTAGDPR